MQTTCDQHHCPRCNARPVHHTVSDVAFCHEPDELLCYRCEMSATFRDNLARAAQEWLLWSDSIPGHGNAGAAFMLMMHDLLGEQPADFMEAIIVELVEIDAWNK